PSARLAEGHRKIQGELQWRGELRLRSLRREGSGRASRRHRLAQLGGRPFRRRGGGRRDIWTPFGKNFTPGFCSPWVFAGLWAGRGDAAGFGRTEETAAAGRQG